MDVRAPGRHSRRKAAPIDRDQVLSYWVARLEPLLGARDAPVFVCANRVGVEDEIQFVGCSCVIDLRRRAPRVLTAALDGKESIRSCLVPLGPLDDDDGDDDDEGDDSDEDEEGDDSDEDEEGDDSDEEEEDEEEEGDEEEEDKEEDEEEEGDGDGDVGEEILHRRSRPRSQLATKIS